MARFHELVSQIKQDIGEGNVFPQTRPGDPLTASAYINDCVAG